MSIDPRVRLGVDLGGTKTEAVVVRGDETGPEVLTRQRIPTDREGGYEAIVAGTARLICDVAHDAGLALLPPVGVGMPGSVTFRRADGTRSPEALVKNSNTTCLNGRPFRADLTRALAAMAPAGSSDVLAFANDANCFALAEATYGAARGARVAFGVIMGTGVGGGIVLKQADSVVAWDGAHGIAGEWGHVVLDPASPRRCYCGHAGCIERFLSGPAIEAAYSGRTGNARPLVEIAALAGTDADARTTLDDVLESFGKAVAIVVDILDPDVIVLGGGVSNLEVLYAEGPAAVGRYIFNDEFRTPIVKNALGDSAGVLGAAALTGG
ncbi:MAG TPA: ROK family protein [Polyangiaceae bacterium]|nr:ROK family protein [Polyangiaceae bacterium]